MELGELVAVVKLNTEQFTTAHGVVSSRLAQMDRDAAKASAGFAALGSRLESVGGQLQSVGMGLTASITAPLLGVGIASLKVAGDMEMARVAFTNLLGSGEKAQAYLEQLRDFAMKTPFELPGLISATQRLMAMGIAAEKVIPTMTAIGDAVAGVGGSAETLNRVVMAIGQIQAKGKLSAEEMLQLAEAGIPAWAMVAEKIGKTVPEAMKLAEKGAIDANTAIAALTEGMEKRFGGMMAQGSKTWTGMLSNFKDQITKTLDDIGKSLMSTGKGILTAGSSLLDWISSLAAAFGKLPTAVQTTVIALAGIAAAIGPAVVAIGLLSSGVGQMIVMWARLAPLFAGGAGSMVAGVVGLGSAIATVLVPALLAAAAAMTAISAAREAWNFLDAIRTLPTVQNAISSLSGILDDLRKKLVEGMPAAVKEFDQSVVSIVDLIKSKLSEISWSDVAFPLKAFTRSATEALQDLATGTDKTTREMNASIERNLVQGTASAADKIRKQFQDIIKAMANSATTLTGALATLGLKSTATLQTEYDTAKKAYEVIKASTQADIVKKAALEKLNEAAKALYGTVSTLGDAFKKLGGESYEDIAKGFKQAEQAYKSIVAAASKGRASTLDVALAFADLEKAADKANKSISAIYEVMDALNKAEIGSQKGWGLQLLAAGIDEAEIHIQFLNAALEEVGNANFDKTYSEFLRLSGAAEHVKEVLAEYSKMDAINPEKLAEQAQIATEVYNMVWSDYETKGIGSVLMVQQAAVNMWQAQIQLARATGEEVDQTWVSVVDGMQKSVDSAMGKTQQATVRIVDSLREIKRVFSSFGEDIAKTFSDMLFHGGSVVDGLKNAFLSLAESITEVLIKAALRDLAKSLLGINTQGLGLAETFKGFIKLFDKSAQTLSEAPKTINAVTDALGNAPSAIGTPGAKGGGAGSASGLMGALSGLAGTVTMIAAVIDAIFQALEYFQMRRIEKDIGRIEVTTRGILNEALNNRKDQWDQHWDIMRKIDDFMQLMRDISGIHVFKWNAFLNKYLGQNPDMPNQLAPPLGDGVPSQALNAVDEINASANRAAAAANEAFAAAGYTNAGSTRLSYATENVGAALEEVSYAVEDHTDAVVSASEAIKDSSDAMVNAADVMNANVAVATDAVVRAASPSTWRVFPENLTPALQPTIAPQGLPGEYLVSSMDITPSPAALGMLGYNGGGGAPPVSLRPWPNRITLDVPNGESLMREFMRQMTEGVLRQVGFQGVVA